MTGFAIRFCSASFVAALGVALPATAAVSFPTRPVRLVVPTAPGGGVDTSARILAQQLTENWGQQVIVDNRGGGSGVIGSEIVAHAPADGYTLLIAPTTFSTTGSIVAKLPYDPLRDFVPVALVSREPNVLLTHPSIPAKSVQELIALVKAKPQTMNFGAGGVGSTASLTAELFKQRTGTQAAVLTYKGAGPAVNALVAGEVQVMFIGLPPTLPLVKSKKLQALAVTAEERSLFLPAVPTMVEAGMRDFVVTNWIGILAPAGTPKPLVHKISAVVRETLDTPAMRERFATYGVTPAPLSPEAFDTFLRAEMTRWAGVIKAAKLPVN